MARKTHSKLPAKMSEPTFADPVMEQLYQRVLKEHGELPAITPLQPEQYFQDLAESIIGQQLSPKVVNTIRVRVTELLGGAFIPAQVLQTEIEALRGVGLSYAKANYLHNLAQAWESQGVSPEKYPEWENEDIITDLVKIKGIGRWTVEMFLLFGMGREDVFSVGDFALRKAVVLAYGLPEAASHTDILVVTEAWQPKRSLASRVLWKSLELPPQSLY